MNKVLHISKYYYPFSGGTEQTARDCVLSLKDNYWQKVIAFNDVKDDREIVVDGVDVIKCGTFIKVSSQSLSASYRKKLKCILDEFQPDIIIFHYPNPFVASFLLKELKGRDAIKLVVYWHLDIIKQKFLKYFFGRQNKQLLERADKVIATSPNYIDGSPWLKTVTDKCSVIPSCINEERMQLTEAIKSRAYKIKEENKGKTICVAVGRHTEYKGFKYLIQASKLVDDNILFYITGEGELTEELHNEVKGNDKVIFTGRIADDELKALIFACDIFCFPSITKNEAFGLALAEAMYYEKPAITFTIPGSGVNYVSIAGVTGIEVENRNVQKYAEAIKRLAENSDLRKRYGEAGRQRVFENFLFVQYSRNIRYLLEII